MISVIWIDLLFVFACLLLVLILCGRRPPHINSAHSIAWFSRVGKILYINLDKRADRRDQVVKTLTDTLGVPAANIERIAAVSETPGWRGCCRSHRLALQTAIDRGYEYVCILEDDFMPVVDAERFHTAIQTAWDSLRGDFDMLMLAMTPIRLQRIRLDPLFRVRTSLALAGYIVSRRFMRELVRVSEDSIRRNMPIDQVMQSYQTPDRFWYGFYPPVARQAPGFSDIENRHTDYKYLEIDGAMLQISD